jgi:hypothetical protein
MIGYKHFIGRIRDWHSNCSIDNHMTTIIKNPTFNRSNENFPFTETNPKSEEELINAEYRK